MGLADESFEYALFIQRANDKAYLVRSIFLQGETSLVGFCVSSDRVAGVAATNKIWKCREGQVLTFKHHSIFWMPSFGEMNHPCCSKNYEERLQRQPIAERSRKEHVNGGQISTE